METDIESTVDSNALEFDGIACRLKSSQELLVIHHRHSESKKHSSPSAWTPCEVHIGQEPQRAIGGLHVCVERLPLVSCTTSTASVLDLFLQPLSDAVTFDSARRIPNLRAHSELYSRVEVLARKANDGAITPEESLEYKAIIDAAEPSTVRQV